MFLFSIFVVPMWSCAKYALQLHLMILDFANEMSGKYHKNERCPVVPEASMIRRLVAVDLLSMVGNACPCTSDFGILLWYSYIFHQFDKSPRFISWIISYLGISTKRATP